MERKRGITTVVISLAVVIMFIILTSATIIGSRNIDTVNYEEFRSQLGRVSDGVNEYYLSNEELPTTGHIVAKANLPEALTNELKANGDIDEESGIDNDLYIIDMSKLDINNVTRGNGTVDDRDLFLVAENSNNIYYYKGYKFRKTMYYGV